MDQEAILRGEVAALRNLYQQLADDKATAQQWDESLTCANGHLIAIAKCHDALLETNGFLARQMAARLNPPVRKSLLRKRRALATVRGPGVGERA